MFSLVLSACKGLSPLYKSSKRRNHLKPDNLEIFFLLLALKMPVKSVTSYQAEIKYLEEVKLQHSKVLFFIFGNKNFCFFKKMSLCFFGRGYILRGEQSFPNDFFGGLLKKNAMGWKEASERFIFFVGGRGQAKLQVKADTMEDTMIGFRKVIYENVEKQQCLPNKHIYIYGSQTSEFLCRFTCCKPFMPISLCICIKHFQYQEMRKNNSKLKFTKSLPASQFSRGQLKISKCSKSAQKVRLYH